MDDLIAAQPLEDPLCFAVGAGLRAVIDKHDAQLQRWGFVVATAATAAAETDASRTVRTEVGGGWWCVHFAVVHSIGLFIVWLMV